MTKNIALLPRFGITMGDPAGIGPEVSVKAIASLPPALRKRVVLIGETGIIEDALKSAKIKLDTAPFDPEKLPPAGKTAFISIPLKTRTRITPGKISAKSGIAASLYIKKGVELSLKGSLSGLVTAPIHKKAFQLGRINYPGHTEMLAELSSTKNVGMMLASNKLRVVVLTTHLSLKSAIKQVKKRNILKKIELIQESLKPKKPIAVCGLNPHASDGGIFGNEEEKEILPAIKAAQSKGINVLGPFPADSLFSPQVRKNYGVILAMYHDQGLVGIKSISFGKCANITLGLPFIRTSVDHGTALEIAGRNLAIPTSMIYAIKEAFELWKRS